MAEIKLSTRLSAIAALIPSGGGVADVGTDHGFIPAWLCQRGENSPIFAADINPEPLERAAKTAADYGLKEQLSLVLTNGLLGFDAGLIGCAVIAGMGGETIINILQRAAFTKSPDFTLVLQPMSKACELRRWLFKNGYIVTGEQLVEDGRLYELFSATGGQDCPYTEAELYTGHTELISKNPLYARRLSELIQKAERALEGLSQSSGSDLAERIAEQKRLLQELLKLRAATRRMA